MTVSLSGTGAGTHEGRVPLAGVERLWVVHDDGMTFLSLDDRKQSNDHRLITARWTMA